MGLYVLRRILYAIPILIGVSLLTFCLFYLTVTPEQMARRNLAAKNPTKQQLHEWIVQHGYDKPPARQFVTYVGSLFQFKFGKSDATSEPIADRLKSGVLPSLQIQLLVFLGALITDLFFAVYFAYYRGTYIDNWGRFLCVLMMSITYIVYIISGQYVFGKLLRLSPIAGYHPGIDSWRFALIPMLVGIISGFGSSVRLYRTFILEEVGQDYVRTARAKGINEQRILFQHVLKNAAIPILTSVVMTIPFLVAGSLLLESFFGIPGIGSITFEAIQSNDFATVRATTFLFTILYIVGAIGTDISYAVADPRVRLE